uniref:ER membrane protein complex subunit 4 n=1 Tax=Castor canadensis TaxID=51338 RepID=A0A8C0VXG8_CASCN
MTAQGGLVANRGRRFKWAIELSGPGGGSRGRSDRGSGQGDSLYPVGYLDKQVPDTSVQETDRILVEKAWRLKITSATWTGGVDQMVEYLLCKSKALSSNPSPTHFLQKSA